MVLTLKILEKQWLHLLGLQILDLLVFKLQRKKLGQNNGSFLLLLVKLYIYAGFAQVDQVMGRLAESTGFCWFFSFAGLLPNPGPVQPPGDRVPGQPARLVRV